MSLHFPQAFEDRMRLSLGAEWQAFAAAHLTPAPVSIRINPAKTDLPESNLVPWTSFGQYLNTRPVFTLDPAFHAGAFYVQEASSMFLEQVMRQAVDLTKPVKVLDLCAAPGGKSTHLLSLISQDSLLVTNEVIRARTAVLSENIQKWGSTNVVVTQNDPRDFQRLQGYFDVIVLDAPCSGEGLFRKDAAAMEEWSPDNAGVCAQRQRRILQDIWPALKKDGVLIYCTCTYNPQENEDNLDWLQQKGAEPVNIKIENSWGIQQGSNDAGCRFYPHLAKGEGFFMAAFRKMKDEVPVRIKSKPWFSRPTKKVQDQIKTWVKEEASLDYILHDDLILAIPSTYTNDIEWLSKELKVITKGTSIATLKHEKLIPEHAAALMCYLKKSNFNLLELDKEQALSYLRKDVLQISDPRKGFALVTHKNLSLGWVNLLGSRINNLYPSAWRIRMPHSSTP